MKKYILIIFTSLNILSTSAQINTERVMMIGRNALYFEDYVLAIQYFNQIIKTKPYIADSYYYRAIAKYFLEDFKGAEEDCTLSIERNEFLYSAYQLRADARQNQKKYRESESDYEISLKQNPYDKFILINLGIVNIETKDYDQAEKYLNTLIASNPKFTEGILTKANLYLEKKDTIQAIENINKAIDNDKYFAPGYTMRASVNLMQKRYDDAINDFDQAINIDPLNIASYINRGLARYYKNDLRGSMNDYDYAIKHEPSNLIARFNRALLRAQVGDDNNAVKDFDFVIQNEPNNYIAYMNRAIVKSNIGDSRGALADLDKVLDEYPNFYQGYQFRSEIKRNQNDLKGAEKDYNTALKIENKIRQDLLTGKTPNGNDSDDKTREESDKTIDKFNLLVVADKEEQEKNKYKNKSRGQIQNKQAKIDLQASFVATYYEKENEVQKYIHFNKEVEDINKLDKLNHKLILTNRETSLDSIQIIEHFESIDSYSRLIGIQPNDPFLYLARGLDHMLIQDYNSAIEDFNRCIKIDDNLIIAYFNQAVAYEKLLRAKLENPDLYKSNINGAKPIKSTPIVNNGLVNTTSTNEEAMLSNSLISKLEYDQIINNYNKVIELSPNFTFAYYNRAGIKALQNDIRGAILDYNEVLRRDSDFADAYYNRGINRLKLKDNERGLDDLRKAGELGIISAYSIVKRMTD